MTDDVLSSEQAKEIFETYGMSDKKTKDNYIIFCDEEGMVLYNEEGKICFIQLKN